VGGYRRLPILEPVDFIAVFAQGSVTRVVTRWPKRPEKPGYPRKGCIPARKKLNDFNDHANFSETPRKKVTPITRNLLILLALKLARHVQSICV